MTRRVLFVCTGNIFRSLTADVALRSLLAARKDMHVSIDVLMKRYGTHMNEEDGR